EWLNSRGLTLESRSHLITDAGQLVPGFSLAEHGVEFFVHSPFASRQDDGTFVDRNTCSLVMQAVFDVLGRQTKLLLAADTTPHRQAAKYYRDNRADHGGTFVVTMEHPKVSAPEALVITIDHRKATIKKRAIAASVAVTSVSAPRAGARRA